jgi:UDP-galactopyranose mutase
VSRLVDLLIVGAGPTGCVIAEQAASLLDWKLLIVDKRSHIAGNCFDEPDCDTGILVHRYGPHYYRTTSEEQVRYLSRFTDWVPGNYFVKSLVEGKYYPFPININTLELFFRLGLTSSEAEQLVKELREPIQRPTNSEEAVVAQVGRVLYEAFYLNYTLKQWGMHPRELSPTVCERIPVRLNRDDRYFDERFQIMPRKGYAAMMAEMIRHPNIELVLNCNYWEIRDLVRPRHATVYSGPLDEYFSYQLGKLPYRSLNFEYVTKDLPWFQPSVQVNYPDDRAYTRTVEYKHLASSNGNRTIVCYEYPCAAGEPFYPVPSPATEALAEKYRHMAEREKVENHVYFSGRLAEYRYLNMNQVIQNAVKVFEEIRRDSKQGGGRAQ